MSNILYTFSLPKQKGCHIERLVVRDHGTHLSEALEYFEYGLWRASMFSWPRTVEEALTRLRGHSAECDARIDAAIAALIQRTGVAA